MEIDTAGCRAYNRNYIVGGGCMAIISKEGLLKVLVSYNPWW